MLGLIEVTLYPEADESGRPRVSVWSTTELPHVLQVGEETSICCQCLGGRGRRELVIHALIAQFHRFYNTNRHSENESSVHLSTNTASTHPHGVRRTVQHEGIVRLQQWWEPHHQAGYALLGTFAEVLGVLAPRQEELVAVHVRHNTVEFLWCVAKGEGNGWRYTTFFGTIAQLACAYPRILSSLKSFFFSVMALMVVLMLGRRLYRLVEENTTLLEVHIGGRGEILLTYIISYFTDISTVHYGSTRLRLASITIQPFMNYSETCTSPKAFPPLRSPTGRDQGHGGSSVPAPVPASCREHSQS